jgi:heme-degrading monooxygenase HmoA
MAQPTPAVPALVTLDIWGVVGARVPAALLRMAVDRRRLRRADGLLFAKLLGTSSGRTFTPRDADPRQWALLATWASADAVAAFERSATVAAWRRISAARLRVAMRPLASRGRWAGQEPFGRPEPRPHDGPVAAITRARIVPRKAGRFWRAVPPVSADLRGSPGLWLAIGIGEAPIGLQGTFSLWESAAALREFAHRRAPHVEAIRRTAAERWYSEELFARFAVTSLYPPAGSSLAPLAAGSAPQGARGEQRPYA